jgi:single-strand DNA-binding protein
LYRRFESTRFEFRFGSGKTKKIETITIKKSEIMMNIKNHVQLVGRLGANPEVKVLESGKKLARFQLAVNESYTKASGEKVNKVQWHSVIAWGHLAGIAEKLLQKGTQVTIDGKLLNQVFTNKAGEKRSATEIVASELFVIGRPATTA